jgi:hypothetical protein
LLDKTIEKNSGKKKKDLGEFKIIALKRNKKGRVRKWEKRNEGNLF